MTTPPPARAHDDAPRVGERSLARGVTATWWYTFGGILFFGIVSISQWPLWIPLHFDDGVSWRLALAAASALLGAVGVAVLLRAYRPHVRAVRDDGRRRLQPTDAIGLGAAAVAAALMGIATGSWVAGASILAFALSAQPWMRGIRWRVVFALTIALIALAIAEARVWELSPRELPLYVVPALFAGMLPLLTGSSLWWWDIVLELDRARQAESLLAATRERLRLANDVHDLQGHHLQVIALQLELADRLMERDPEGARREIARAREAVDAARQGTRDLAAQFRGVPLPDELHNAADLLRSAGLEVDAAVAPDVVGAPADVLGPIVRESVTNVLKHGGGRWARLALARDGDRWIYRVANDDAGHDEIGWGSGLEGMTERVRALGGEVDVQRTEDEFALRVSLPATLGGSE